jgi:hypothetical protein
MKKLFVLVGNGGDGSYHVNYTMNEVWIAKQQHMYDTDDEACDYEYGLGVDGDGFHYDVLTVPDGCSLESLGISFDCAEDD